MKNIAWGYLAEEDLYGVTTYLATNESELHARRLLSKIFITISTIANTPYIGRERNELQKNLRSFPAWDYQVFYRLNENDVEIVRIIHSSRDIESLFERGR
jgi:toxin ParE1/3/4